VKEARYIAVASRWAQSREVLELDDKEETLATRLIAAMNVSSMDINGDGLDERSKDCLITMTDEDCAVAAMSTRERGPVITKEILAKRWAIGLDTAHRALTATTQQGI
jgi:phosphatidylserine decarboxylase